MQNRKLKVEFYFTSPATDTFSVSVYKGTTRVPLTTDSAGATNLPKSTTGKFTAYFDTDSSGTWTVSITKTAGGGSTPLQFTNVVVGPGIQPQGAVVGEWQSYTPTVSNLGAGSGTATGYYRRVGSGVEVRINFVKDGTAGSGASPILFGLPSVSIDFTKAGSDYILGLARLSTSSTYSWTTASSLYATSLLAATNAGWQTGANATAGSRFELEAFVPVAEWAGSGTVQLAQNDVEYASNNSPTATADDSSSFAYGPSGSRIPSVTLSTAVRKRVRFQTPIQVGDRLSIELNPAGTSQWYPLEYGAFLDTSGRSIATATDASSYGVGYLRQISNTDVDVYFFRYRTSTANWSDITETVNWRVRKSSAGAAVGFGIVQPGISSGLVSSSGLPGNTSGQAIAAGYVGELSTSATWGGTFSVGTQNLATLTLNKGNYLILTSGQVNTTNFRQGLSISTVSTTTDTGSVVISAGTTGNTASALMAYRFLSITSDNTPVYAVGQFYDGTTSASGRIQSIRIS
jgi:hypothetical protein